MLYLFRSTPSSLPFLLLVVLALLPYVTARRDMAKFFNAGNYYFPDRNDNNGCKDRVSTLTSAYEEAAELADGAVEALEVLAKKRPEQLTDPVGFSRWVAKSNMLSAFFKIDLNPNQGGPVATSQTDWDNVNKLFKLIQAGFESDAAPGQTPAMYCGVRGWKYVAPGDPDPNNAPRLLKERKDSLGKEEFPDGVWHFNKHYKRAPKPTSSSPEIQLCVNKQRQRLIAVTSTDLDVITWCPLAFGTNPSLATKLPTSVKAGDELLTDTKQITLSWTFLHELAHFHGARPNIGLGGPRVIDHLVNYPNSLGVSADVPAYGAGRVLKLAVDTDATTATHNADTYGTFAVAVHFPDFDWSRDGKPVAI